MKQKRIVSMFKGNGLPMKSRKIDRNSPCECKSGKKAKNCCGTETKYYYEEKSPASKIAKK